MTIDQATAQELMSVMANPGLQSEIAQLRARGVLQDIGAETDTIAWRYEWTRVLRNATGALAGLEARAADLSRGSATSPVGRRLAQLWESIAKLEDADAKAPALANAALAYEISGYQAAAACLARQLGRTQNRTDGGDTTFERLTAVFLQRQFLLLKRLGIPLLSEPPSDSALDELWVAATEALATKALMKAADYFLSGSEAHLLASAGLLERAELGYTQMGLVRPAVMSRSLNSALAVMAERSTWRRLAQALPDNPAWNRYIRLLARGLDREVLRASSVSELWPSQLQALDEGLLSKSAAKIVRMPTSAGKTRIAEIAMVHSLLTSPGSLCVYVAPYRALASEIEGTFAGLFSDLGYVVSSLAGAYETDSFELDLAATSDVLVLTPEKLDLLDRLTPGTLDRVAMILLDESQLVADLTRGPKFELLVTRLRRRLPECTFVSLSAVISEETLSEVADWLGRGDAPITSSNWRPTVQRVARFEWSGIRGVLRYVASDDTEVLAGFVPGILAVEELSFINPETGRRRTRRFPDQTNKGQVAAALAIQASELGQVLIFCAQPMFADAAANAVVDRLAIGRLAGEEPIGRFSVGATRSLQLAREWLGSDHPTTRALEAGVAVHHGGIPDAVRKAVEQDFRERRFPVLVATNTLAQGVNLPVRTVVVHSVRRYDEENQQSIRLPSRDYWNIAGRAGRAHEETEGSIVHIIGSPTDRTDFDYYLDHRANVEGLDSALLVYLRALVANRLSEQALATRLDSDILALLVEEGVESADDVERAVAIAAETLGWAQAVERQIDTGPLGNAIRRAATTILRDVPDSARRRLFSSTGLSTASSRLLYERAESNVDVLRGALTARETSVDELLDAILPAVSDLPEVVSPVEIEASHDEVIRAWLHGSDPVELRRQFTGAGTSPEVFAKFIEQHVGYRLPWGVSGYVRIARVVCDLSDADLNQVSRYFAAMLRFGVSVPAASWCMSLGVPSRQLAQAMGVQFESDHPSEGFESLRSWLGEIDFDDLRDRFGVRPPLLDDVFQVCIKAGISQRLTRHGGTDDLLPTRTPLKGVGYGERRAAARVLQVGDELELQRDYDNVADRNAILVFEGTVEIGYIPRSLAQVLAADLDTGRTFLVTVTNVEQGGLPEIEVELAAAT